MIKIPRTIEGLVAIETCIADGIAAAAQAYLRGVERRLAAGLDPAVGSVAPVFISRWDIAVADSVPAELHDHLGLTIGLDVCRSYRQILDSDRFQALANAGTRPQRVLWASTGTKDPKASHALLCAWRGCAVDHQHHARPDTGGVLRPRGGRRCGSLLNDWHNLLRRIDTQSTLLKR